VLPTSCSSDLIRGRHGGLGQMQPCRSSGEALDVHDCEECLELTYLHDAGFLSISSAPASARRGNTYSYKRAGPTGVVTVVGEAGVSELRANRVVVSGTPPGRQ
jgi:hypothetical protein